MPEKEEVIKALQKPAQFGPDIDLEAYGRESSRTPAGEAPMRIQEEGRAGTYLQVDYSVVRRVIREALRDSVEIVDMREARKRHDLAPYYWKLVNPATDKYTAWTYLNEDRGVFIRVKEGVKVPLPLQACFFIGTEGLNQNVHNIIVMEPDSEATIVTGCAAYRGLQRGLHVGVTEFYLKKNAKLNFTMIHYWGAGFDARPRAAARLEEGASLVSNYICALPVKSIQMYPTAFCEGDGSSVTFNNLILAQEDSLFDLGGRIIFSGKESRGEVLTRVVAKDRAKVWSRSCIVGDCEDCRGHVECMGLLLSPDCSVHAIPELVAKKRGAELTHEAAIGKIAREQVEYLMSRGLTEKEATSLIVKGFVEVGLTRLPDEFLASFRKLLDVSLRQL